MPFVNDSTLLALAKCCDLTGIKQLNMLLKKNNFMVKTVTTPCLKPHFNLSLIIFL